jgi:predicted dehydrogenase
MIRIGVIGYGYWGPNMVRNFAEHPDCEMAAVSDVRPERLSAARLRHRGVLTTANSRELIHDPRIDAVAICTSVFTHFELATEALRAGKHVLVEKPMAASSEEASRMIEEAARRRRVLMVDHTFVYTGAVRKIREVIRAEDFGEIYYYDSVRVNLGLFQRDVNVIWDLAVHDFSILDYLLPIRPCAVSATGLGHVPGSGENIAYITAFFESTMIGHVNVNWLAPVKVRQTLIGGSQKMIVYDDLEPSEKVKVYDRGITLDDGVSLEGTYGLLVGYRTGDMWAPRIDRTEALRREIAHFVECIETGSPPETGGEAGLRVVRLLEGATESLRQRGRPVELRGGGLPA